MKQSTVQQFASECGKIKVFVDNDTPVGVIHDYLMKVKGHMVDIMVANHKQEKQQAEEQAKLDGISECESSCTPCDQ